MQCRTAPYITLIPLQSGEKSHVHTSLLSLRLINLHSDRHMDIDWQMSSQNGFSHRRGDSKVISFLSRKRENPNYSTTRIPSNVDLGGSKPAELPKLFETKL